MRFSRLVVLGLATVTFPALTALVQAQHSITPLAKVKFVPDDDVKCLSYALESGDPDKGASTIILKAPPRCLVRWHFHTAVEGLMVVRGQVLTEMEGVPATTLGAGGFATMSSGAKHQFACTGTSECILFVTFDRIYDIHWVDQK